ncbi:AbiV family abortive infection protein [Sphingomonas sp. PAMC 26617]|uniref:AbiV family abortive infection protein n=1 Tax=Sphingomonas sp. PAMC 26617 TaxID=1112216 RepID=UPI000497DB72|nr:AbiV family abortive infection protein [Sphingomonas sp. PAMC 26617]
MTEIGVPLSAEKMRAKIDEAINACIENAQRLHEKTYDLELRSLLATRYYLLVIAQKEAAKAFLLYLIREQIVSLTAAVRRALNDHACKHLVGMIIDYMIMHWELDELKAIIALDASLGADFPNDVGSAIEILRYEKIGRWTANNWSWAEDPQYDKGTS